MSKALCDLLKNTPPGTAVQELMMNGEDVSGVEEFVRYDETTGLVYFTNKSNNVFVALCDKIDMIEFLSLAKIKKNTRKRRRNCCK